ncbi:MAG: Uma2 family endonuclease [Gemmataceae bacterium]
MVVRYPPYRFTVDQYDRMIDVGILSEHDRVVLIRGRIVPKTEISGSHSQCVDRLTKLFVWRVADDITVSIQNPIVLADSEPEPDVTLVDASYRTRRAKPVADDVRLLIEVADSSLAEDLGPGAALYAENGIPEYWVVDLVNARVHVHRGPQPDGSWASVVEHTPGATLTVVALPSVTVTVEELLA